MNLTSSTLTMSLAQYAERAIQDWTESSVKWLVKEYSNPYRAEIRYIDDIKTFIIRNSKNLWWCNTSFDLIGNNYSAIERVVAFYRSSNQIYRFQFTPYDSNEEFEEMLRRCELQQSSSSMTLCRRITSTDQHEIPAGVKIKDVNSQEALDTFVHIYIEGYECLERDADTLKEMRLLYRNPEAKLSIAYIDDTPAAVGIFFVSENADCRVGYFGGSAATLPRFRRYGCQTALIRHRLAQAAEAKCALVAVTTGVDTPSTRNLKHEGFSVLHQKATWTDARNKHT